MAKKPKAQKKSESKKTKAPAKSAAKASASSKLSGLKKLLLGSSKPKASAKSAAKTAAKPAAKPTPKVKAKDRAKPVPAPKTTSKVPAKKEAMQKSIPTQASITAGGAPAPVVVLTKPQRAPRGGAAGTVLITRSRKKDAGDVCREVACEMLATSSGYCRMHYIKNWKKIKQKEVLLKERKLDRYIEELVAKYPDKYIEAIRQDLLTDKEFAQVARDLEITDATDDDETTVETESGTDSESFIDSIRKDFGADDVDF